VTAATGVSRQAQDYLAAVELELADLPADDRSALLEDLALHLDALTTEDDDRPLHVRLGSPAAYATDLRAAAGLPARATGSLPAVVGLRKWLDRATPVTRRVGPAARATRRLLGELRPAWWVLRGYLLVLVPCLMELDGVRDFPVPAPMDNHFLGLLLVVAAVAGSVALGRRKLPRAVGVGVALGGVVLVLVAFEVWDDASSDGMTRSYASSAWQEPAPEQAMGQYPLLSRYGPVTDVLPYAADGTPLEDVLLFDQDGRPLQVGKQIWWEDGCPRVLDQPLAEDGVPVSFTFPQSYVIDPDWARAFAGADNAPACVPDVPRPEVPIPTFPAAPTAPAPGD
jgi:hypothetical protein